MMVNVYNQNGESVDTTELNPKIFALEKVRPEIVHEVVVQLQSTNRGSIAHSKTRGEVRGGGKKPWQQKGTGRARVGSIRSPLWRGGGITFGPRSQRNWDRKINKKLKTKALFSVLSDKVKTGQLVVLDSLSLSAPKTKELSLKIKDLRAKFPTLGKKMTLVTTEGEHELARAGANLPGFAIQTASNLDIIGLLSSPGLVVMRGAIPMIEKTYLRVK